MGDHIRIDRSIFDLIEGYESILAHFRIYVSTVDTVGIYKSKFDLAGVNFLKMTNFLLLIFLISSNENLHQLKHKGGYGSTERKRSISESALTGTATRLPTHPSQRMLKEVDRGRSRHEFTDWLEEQRQKNLKCNKTTKIIRIDINEIDQVASSEIHGVHYLDDLFKESNINKFYTFDNKNLSTQSFFLGKTWSSNSFFRRHFSIIYFLFESYQYCTQYRLTQLWNVWGHL